MITKELGITVIGRDQASGVLHGITGTLGNLAKVGIGAVVAGFGAIAGGIASTIGPAADFQSQVALMGIASKETGAALDILDDAAIKVGGDSRLVGVDAAMAAEAMTNLYKAGLDTGEMFGDMQGYMAGTAELGGALRASIDLAAASELDMAQASDIVAIAMATFGLNADEAVNIANNFVQTADASVTSVSELADAMVNVGPTAAAFGWSMEDVNTALAILSERGIKGAEAGTALKSMMTNMMRPTVAVTSTLKKLNVSLYDQDGALKSLPKIMKEVGKGMAKLTEEERNQAVQALAGTYGMKAMNTLLAEGVEGWEDMALAIDEAATAQDVSAAIVETFSGKMEAMRGVVDTLKISIGDKFLPVFGDLVGAFTSFLEDNAQGIEDFFGGIADWLGENLPVIISGFATFVTEKLVPVLQEVFKWLGENVPKAIEAVGTFWRESLQPALAELWAFTRDKVIPALQDIFSWLGENVPKAMAALSGFWNSTLQPALAALWAFTRDKVIPIIEDIVAWLGDNVPTAMAAISDFWDSTLSPALTALWEFVRDDVIPIIEDIAAWLGEHVPEAMQGISDFWNQTLKPAFQAIIDLWNNDLKPAAQTLATMFEDTLKTAWDTLTSALSWAKTHILDPVATAFNSIKSAIEGVIGFIQGLIDKLGEIDWGAIPDWMIPGSPTPFELGIRGISAAIRAMPKLSLPVNVGQADVDPRMGGGRDGFFPRMAPLIVHNHFGRDSVRSDADILELSNQIAQDVRLRTGAVLA